MIRVLVCSSNIERRGWYSGRCTFVKCRSGCRITPVGPAKSYTRVPYKRGLLGGGAIWRPCVSFVAWICCGMVMTRVVMESSPGFCGMVDAIHSCGANRCFGHADWQA